MNGPASPPYVSLSELLERLGPLLMRAHNVGGDLPSVDPRVRAAVVWDPSETVPPTKGGVLLLTGASLMPGSASSAIREAAASGYAAVVMKSRDLAEDAIDVSSAGEVQILAAPNDASWNSLHELINDAVSTTPETAPAALTGIAPGDLFSLANAIAAVAGTAITIENVNREVVAYSNIADQGTDDSRRDAILGRAVPDLPWYLARYRAVAMATQPIFFGQENGALDRVAMPVRVGSRLVGSLWAFDEGGTRSDDIARVLADAAPVTSLHLLHADGAYNLQRHRRGELLTAALGSGPLDPGVAQTLAKHMPMVLIGLAHSGETGTDIDLGRAADIVALNAEAIRRTASCTVMGNRVFVLIPDAEQLTDERILSFLNSCQRAVAGAAGIHLRGAYSGLLNAVSDLKGAQTDIETAFRFQTGKASDGSLSVAKDRHRVLLQELSEGTVAVPGRLLESVQTMLDYDADNGTEYAGTLLAYLNAFGDNRRAAEEMMVHENSQRYRMRQLSKKFGIEMDNPEQRLIVWLQLHLQGRKGR
ncbi:PucR family transcriptional regulator [Paenarthrobacter nitroguajacolicus]|uniref:PucR family transcriptional regulator n=1 Tax=Paenarthrobacter nitroguajacolicus TaxID=211146 RepID=UPI0015C09792|nr:helix-turn-helix domain-containing protein [Paenarthrobacter nitroguajacolicus]